MSYDLKFIMGFLSVRLHYHSSETDKCYCGSFHRLELIMTTGNTQNLYMGVACVNASG